MKTHYSIFIFLAVRATCSLAQPQTPFDMAMVLEQELATGVGLLMPDPNTPYARYHGVLPLPSPSGAGFPQGFLNGLVGVTEHTTTVYPVTLRVDDTTGDTVFYNATTNAFWSETPTGTYYADWIEQLYGAVDPQTQALLYPSHVEARWLFIAEQDIPAYHEALLASLTPTGQGTGTLPERTDIPVFRVIGFFPSTDAYYFGAIWNDVAYFPNGKMDVLFTPDLLSPNWSVVQSIPVANAPKAAAFAVPRVALPPPSSVTHDPGCTPTDHIVVSPLNPNVSYTNTVCGCLTTAAPSPTGFFRLDIQETVTGIPAWWRVLYGFAPFASWEDGIDFTGDGYTNTQKYGLKLNPIAPPDTNGTTATIQYHYDGDDRLTTTFIGTKGDAATRQLTPAGNPSVQQERNAQ